MCYIAMKTYNTSVHERMKYTLHELVFRKSARVSSNSILPDNKINESYPEYAIQPHYSTEYSTFKYQHVRALNMQKLDLSDMTVKQIHRHLTRTIMYIC